MTLLDKLSQVVNLFCKTLNEHS